MDSSCPSSAQEDAPAARACRAARRVLRDAGGGAAQRVVGRVAPSAGEGCGVPGGPTDSTGCSQIGLAMGPDRRRRDAARRARAGRGRERVRVRFHMHSRPSGVQGAQPIKSRRAVRATDGPCCRRAAQRARDSRRGTAGSRDSGVGTAKDPAVPRGEDRVRCGSSVRRSRSSGPTGAGAQRSMR